MKFPKLTKKHLLLTFASLLLILITTVWIGVAIPMNMSDGTERFEGKEREAAQEALDYIREFYGSGVEVVSAIGTFQYRIEAVHTLDASSPGVYDDCDDYFRVDMSKIGMFGVETAYTYRYVCLKDGY